MKNNRTLWMSNPAGYNSFVTPGSTLHRKYSEWDWKVIVNIHRPLTNQLVNYMRDNYTVVIKEWKG